MKNLAGKVFIGTMILIFTIIGGIGYPLYNVWTSEQAGIAELKKAEGNRKLLFKKLKLRKKESAKSLAEAEIIRAKGVAEANRIIGDSLKNNEAYLRYLWIRNLEDGPNQIIYVPTEANLPLLESSRHIADNLLSKGVLND
jgi:regulator of protease activity HflC (stomatin/prohibitin superfamily)